MPSALVGQNGLCCRGASSFETLPHCICATLRCHSNCGTRPARSAFPSKPTPEETTLRKQFVIFASSTLIITSGLALAQYETPQEYDKSSAPSGLQSTTPDKAPVVTLPEANTSASETGQAANFDDRWSAQGESPGRLPTATMPGADAPRTTDQPRRSVLDQGNGNWDPPPVTAPSTQR
jgi:hypothetical protein